MPDDSRPTSRSPARATVLATLLTLLTRAGCVAVSVGQKDSAHTHLRWIDAGVAAVQRTAPRVDALLVQSLPADALADTASIAYSRSAHELT